MSIYRYLDILPKIKEKTKKSDILNAIYIALQIQPSYFKKCIFMCNRWKPSADFIFPKALCGA